LGPKKFEGSAEQAASLSKDLAESNCSSYGRNLELILALKMDATKSLHIVT
jgi:hypothetical protein